MFLSKNRDRVLDFYSLLQHIVPEVSVQLNGVREVLLSLLRLALEVDNVVSQRVKDKDSTRALIKELETFFKKEERKLGMKE
jgi:hypothetical protein